MAKQFIKVQDVEMVHPRGDKSQPATKKPYRTRYILSGAIVEFGQDPKYADAWYYEVVGDGGTKSRMYTDTDLSVELAGLF